MRISEDNGLRLLGAGAGGLDGVGPGVAGFAGWVVAAVVLLLLAWLAWWTTRPGRRVTPAHDAETKTKTTRRRR